MLGLESTVPYVDIFSSLSKKETLFLQSYLIEEEYKAQELILKQGSNVGNLYIIKRGEADVTIALPGGGATHISTLHPGDIFGEVTFFSHALATANVVAKTAIKCTLLRQKVLNMLRIGFPLLAYKIEYAVAMQSGEKIINQSNNMLTFLHKIAEKETTLWLEQTLPNKDARQKSIPMPLIEHPLLHAIPFIQTLNKNELIALYPFLQATYYEKGSCFSKEEQSIHFIYTGAVMLFMQEQGKLIKRIDLLSAGDLFFLNCIFPEFSNRTCYIACEPSVILTLTQQQYQQLQTTHTSIFYILSSYLHSSIVEFVYKINRLFLRLHSEFQEL